MSEIVIFSDTSPICQIPELVENIFSYLPAKCIMKASSVNHLWHAVAQRVLRLRNAWRTHLISDSRITEEEVKEIMDNSFTRPGATFLFAYKDVWFRRRESTLRRSEDRQLAQALSKIHSQLPHNCPLIGCLSERLLVQQTQDLFGTGPQHIRQGHVMLHVPAMEGVTFHQTHIRRMTRRPSNWTEVFDLPASNDVKVVIILALPQSRDMIPQVAGGIRETYGDNVVVVGAVGHDRLFIDGVIKQTKLTLLFISGQNIHGSAYSLENSSDIPNRYAPVEAMMNDMRIRGIDPRFIFVFTSRFVHIGNTYAASSQVMRQNFPRLPSIGFYSFGQYCLNEPTNGRLRTRDYKRYMCYNSQVLCIMGQSVKRTRENIDCDTSGTSEL